HAGDVVEVERHVVVVGADVAGPQAVLQVPHDPGTVGGPLVPDDASSKIDGFHRALAVVAAVTLHVPVVEAAPVVVELAAGDHVLGLRVVAGRGARGRVVPIA